MGLRYPFCLLCVLLVLKNCPRILWKVDLRFMWRGDYVGRRFPRTCLDENFNTYGLMHYRTNYAQMRLRMSGGLESAAECYLFLSKTPLSTGQGYPNNPAHMVMQDFVESCISRW